MNTVNDLKENLVSELNETIKRMEDARDGIIDCKLNIVFRRNGTKGLFSTEVYIMCI